MMSGQRKTYPLLERSIIAMMVLTAILLVAALQLVSADPGDQCGAVDGLKPCNSSAFPCCSTYGYCGSGSQFCGHGCNNEGSFESTNSCWSTRANYSSQTKCVSGRYDFTDTTWILPVTQWDGTTDHADFTYYGHPRSLVFGEGENGKGISLILTPPADRFPAAGGGGMHGNYTMDGVTTGDVVLTSTTYLDYGKFSARVRAGLGNGVVTSLISMSDDHDEIDWEWTKGDGIVQSNTFSKGRFFSQVQNYNVQPDSGVAFHDYGVIWLPDRVEWYVNDNLVRTYYKNQTDRFPVSRSTVQISIWNGGDSKERGTSGWAGGPIDWERTFRENRQINATFDWVMIQCLDDLDKPEPTGPPARSPGRTKPALAPVPSTSIESTAATASPTEVSPETRGVDAEVTASASTFTIANAQTVTVAQFTGVSAKATGLGVAAGAAGWDARKICLGIVAWTVAVGLAGAILIA
ncbi:concanavalin A-like lectin/glucanase domain-containing protein [Chytridium lagenaria]|nr:concanavalin A-like lectin/glucanase domain-containing protein [Chytridium lagenaria]